MTLEELKSKMKPDKLYYFESKEKDLDWTGEPDYPKLSGRCRLAEDGIECQIMRGAEEHWPEYGKRPGSCCFTIKTDEELEPWEFDDRLK